MLSKRRVEELLAAGSRQHADGIGVRPLVSSLSDGQLGAASVDLRLGRWFHVVQQSKLTEIDLSANDDGQLERAGGRYYYTPFGKKFVVHPGRFVLAATLEWITLPLGIGGYITGKSSLGRRGLVIETAFGIQPGFAGCLALEIYNCGEVPIAITPGMRICQVFFHEVEGPRGEVQSRFSGKRKPVFGKYSIDFQLVVNGSNGELPLQETDNPV